MQTFEEIGDDLIACESDFARAQLLFRLAVEYGPDHESDLTLALHAGTYAGKGPYEDEEKNWAYPKLMAWREEWNLTFPLPRKQELGSWEEYPSPPMFYYLRCCLDDPECIALELRRKRKSDTEIWWRVTIHPPDQTEVYVGYRDDLEEAKALAERAWEAWPERLPEEGR